MTEKTLGRLVTLKLANGVLFSMDVSIAEWTSSEIRRSLDEEPLAVAMRIFLSEPESGSQFIEGKADDLRRVADEIDDRIAHIRSEVRRLAGAQPTARIDEMERDPRGEISKVVTTFRY